MHHKRIECDHCSAKFKNRKSLINHWIGFHEFRSVISRMAVRAIEQGRPLLIPEGKPHLKIRAIAHMARMKKEEMYANKKRIGAKRARDKSRTPVPKALKISLRARNKFKRQQLKG